MVGSTVQTNTPPSGAFACSRSRWRVSCTISLGRAGAPPRWLSPDRSAQEPQQTVLRATGQRRFLFRPRRMDPVRAAQGGTPRDLANGAAGNWAPVRGHAPRSWGDQRTGPPVAGRDYCRQVGKSVRCLLERSESVPYTWDAQTRPRRSASPADYLCRACAPSIRCFALGVAVDRMWRESTVVDRS